MGQNRRIRLEFAAASRTVLVSAIVVILVLVGAAEFVALSAQQFSSGVGTVTKTVVPGQQAQAGESFTINGAGATFPFPLLSKWTTEYNKLKPNIKFNYQSIGSGGGIRQHTGKTIDLRGTDILADYVAIPKERPTLGKLAVYDSI